MFRIVKVNWTLTAIFVGAFLGSLTGTVLYKRTVSYNVREQISSLQKSEVLLLNSVILLMEDKMKRDKEITSTIIQDLLRDPMNCPNLQEKNELFNWESPMSDLDYMWQPDYNNSIRK